MIVMLLLVHLCMFMILLLVYMYMFMIVLLVHMYIVTLYYMFIMTLYDTLLTPYIPLFFLVYKMFGTRENDLLGHLPKSDQDMARRLIIDLVLATDISRHFSLVSQFNTRLSMNNLDLDTTADMTLTLQMIIKCADVSNPSRAYVSRDVGSR